MAAEATNSADGVGTNAPRLFLHARFEVPQPAADGGDDDARGDGCGCSDASGADSSSGRSAQPTAVTEQHFDASNCKPAVVGLPDGVEPVKPEPGDYSYSGMHDHGPLPAPKEGGQFAQMIGLVSAAKKASDGYLTKVIEKEKEANASSTNEATEEGCSKQKKQKTK